MSKHSEIDHLWHVWINRRQDELRMTGEPWEHSLYEFKSMLSFLRYGHKQLQDAFEGKLPVLHQQCSHSPVEDLPDNKLTCCLGVEVTVCPILESIRSLAETECGRVLPFEGNDGKPYQPYREFTDEDLYRIMANTCAWHIFTTATGTPARFSVDTSEGYLLDKSDRMFWDRVYQSMSQPCDPEGE